MPGGIELHESIARLEKAKKLVKVTYEPLPAGHNPPEAWAEDAPRVFDEEVSNVQAYKHIARSRKENSHEQHKQC